MGLLAQIENFGDGAAEEDDAVLSYFLKTEAVDKIECGIRAKQILLRAFA